MRHIKPVQFPPVFTTLVIQNIRYIHFTRSFNDHSVSQNINNAIRNAKFNKSKRMYHPGNIHVQNTQPVEEHSDKKTETVKLLYCALLN